MRIAFFSESFPKQSETFILEQVVDSLKRGHHVDIFPAAGTLSQEALDQFIPDQALHKNLQVFYPSKSINYLATAKNVRFLSTLPSLTRQFGRTNMTQVLRYIVDQPCRDYDAIHAHFGPSARRVALLRRAGILSGPFIATFHGFDVHAVLRTHPISYYNIVFSDAAAITVGSQYMWEKLLWMGAPREKMHLHPMPIDLDFFAYRQPQTDGRHIAFISIGRLIDSKAHRHAIEALARIKDRLPSWHYSIIGEGEERKNLERLIATYDLQHHVKLLGRLPKADVRAQLNAHDIMLHPFVQGRLGSIESQGVVLAEAAAVGLPIVASRVGGIPDTVVDGKNGFLVPSGSVDELSATILKIVQQRKNWGKMGQWGRTHVEAKFDQHSLSDIRHELYRALLRI